MSVTIRDVAARAGVSVATVSRVLNDRPDVAQPIRDRVLLAAEELHYRPSNAARSLRTRATKVIGLVIADISNSFFTAVARGAEEAAHAAGYSMILANTDEDLGKESQYLDVAVEERLAGVMLSPASSVATDVTVLARAHIPLVTIDRRLQGPDADSVTVNNFRAAFDATTHLLDHGCRRVAFIGGPPSVTTGSRRLAGYRAALQRAGAPADAALIVRGDFRVEGGRAAMRTLMDTTTLDGLVVANGLMTIGAMDVLGEQGISIPQQIAVVGFDDEPWAHAYRPSLTVIAQPTYEIGQRAAGLLLERIVNPALEPRRLSLPATLRVRGSSVRARAGGDDVAGIPAS